MTDQEILAKVFSGEFKKEFFLGGIPVVLRTLTTEENYEVLKIGQNIQDGLLRGDEENIQTTARALISVNNITLPDNLEERVALVRGWKGAVVQMIGEAYIHLFRAEREALAELPKS